MRRVSAYVFAGWTVFVWIGRIGLGGTPLLALPFVALALASLWRRRPWITLLAAYTVVVWAIRTPYILVHDHPVAFKAVHTVLAIVSVVLAFFAQRDVQREREASAPSARLQELGDR